MFLHTAGSGLVGRSRAVARGLDMHAPCYTGRASVAGWRNLDGAWERRDAPSSYDGCPLLDAHWLRRHRRSGRQPAPGQFVPRSCALAEFSPRALLENLAGRTLALVGDSLTEQHFQGLACALLLRGGVGPPAWWPTNTTAAELWKSRSCLPFANGALLCYASAGKANERGAPEWMLGARLRSALAADDVVVVNVGVHYANATLAATKLGQLLGPLLAASGPAPRRAEQHAAARLSRAGPLLLYRETAPQHFSGGRWPPTDASAGCVPTPAASLRAGAAASSANAYNEALNPVAQSAGVQILPVWRASALLHAEHLAPPRDCTHWLLPGVIDGHWDALLAAVLAHPDSRAARSASVGGRRSLRKRWSALRRAFVGLPGCVYPRKKRDGGADCCSAECRERGFLPRSPRTYSKVP